MKFRRALYFDCRSDFLKEMLKRELRKYEKVASACFDGKVDPEATNEDRIEHSQCQ